MGYGKKSIFVDFLDSNKHDIRNMSIIIVTDKNQDKYEWIRLLRYYSRTLNIQVLNAHKVPKIVTCDFLIIDISSFRLLNGITHHSGKVIIMFHVGLTINQRHIVEGRFNTMFFVSDRIRRK
jgi:hypothetical protein